MNTLIAGWVAGYLMAVASTIVLVFLTVRFSTPGGLLDRWVANEVPRPILAVPIFVGTTLAWTLAGLILAMFYELADMAARPNGLGSPSWPFTFMMLVLAVLPLAPLAVLARRYWWLWCGMSALFLGLFGWAMPLLAER